MDYLRSELVEQSVVPVPANPAALKANLVDLRPDARESRPVVEERDHRVRPALRKNSIACSLPDTSMAASCSTMSWATAWSWARISAQDR